MGNPQPPTTQPNQAQANDILRVMPGAPPGAVVAFYEGAGACHTAFLRNGRTYNRSWAAIQSALLYWPVGRTVSPGETVAFGLGWSYRAKYPSSTMFADAWP